MSDAPCPLVEIAVEPRSKADRRKLGFATQKLAAEDPTFCFSIDAESGQTMLGGMGELHLDIKIDILKRTYGVEANVGAPLVVYRQMLGGRTEVDYTHKSLSGPFQFARVKIVFEPNELGGGYAFESKVVGGSLPKTYVQSVERGLETAKGDGLPAGFLVSDFKATLVDGTYHDLDSSVLAFEIAARAAFQELRERAALRVFEPIMKVEVTTPEAYVGDVIGDLNARRGQPRGTDERGGAQAIISMTPLANMFGNANTLRSMTQGRAAFQMEYDRHEAVDTPPPDDDFPSAMAMRA